MTYEETQALLKEALEESSGNSVQAWIEESGLDGGALQELTVVMASAFPGNKLELKAMVGGAFQVGWTARGLELDKTLTDALRRIRMRAIDAHNECGSVAPQDHFLQDIVGIVDAILGQPA